MQKFSTLYSSVKELELFIDNNNIDREHSGLVRVVTSIMSREEALNLAENIKKMLPNFDVIGLTSSFSVIFDAEIVDDATFVTIQCYDTLKLNCQIIKYDQKNYIDVCDEIYEKFQKEIMQDAVINVLITPNFTEVNELVLEFNKKEHIVQLAGAVVGIMPHNDDKGFLFTDKYVLDDVIIAFSVSAKECYHYVGANFSYEVSEGSEIYEITEIENDVIKKIDGRDASDWIYEYLHLEDKNVQFSADFLAHFPIVVNYDNSSRFLEFDHDTKQVLIHENTSLPVNTKIQKACITPISTYKHTYENMISILQSPMESIFVYVCLFRKLFLPNCIKWEFLPIKDYDVCGMIAMGELVYLDGSNQYHHGSSILTGLSERETYIVPELDVLKDTSLITKDIDDFSKFVSENSKHYEQNTYAKYYEQLEDKTDKFEIENFYIDNDFKIHNIIKYRQDKLDKKFDKLCLVSVDTADIIISFTGKKIYNEICVDAINTISSSYKEDFERLGVNLYSFNYKAIFFVGTSSIDMETFIDFSKELHGKFEQITNDKHNITLILRFVLIEDKKHMVEKATKFSYENRNTLETFSVVPNEIDTKQQNSDDINMLTIMKWAIDNGGIIPYYQGLYNNELEKIDKYESLIRLKDKEGNVYSPFAFLELSKKYHFYNKLSQLMLGQVLVDFNDRPEKISINLSLRDILYKGFTSWFIEQVENFNDPTRITIELLESDDFKDEILFFDFLKDVRKLGCKIAIDDFGSGYSTFMTILEIEPDYIKIDGSIIKKVSEDAKSAILLETLATFAKKFNCKTIAEFVENEDIQNVIVANDITYSQGYLFSKPSPYSTI